MHVPLGAYRGLLTTYLLPQRSRVVLLALLLFGGIALQLINPQVIRFFIDTAQTGSAEQSLLLAGAVFIGFSLAQRALTLWALYVGENVGWSATNAMRADLARHVLRLDMSFHKQHTPGELIERIDGDVSGLANFFSQFSIRVLGNLLLIAGILLILFIEDWRVGLGLAIYCLVVTLVLGALQNIAVARWEAERQAAVDQFSFLEEAMNGTEDIRSSGAEPYMLRRLDSLMRDLLRKNRSARMVSNLTYVSTNFLFVLGYSLGLAIGAYLYTRGEVSIGTAYVIVFYVGMLAAPLESIRAQIDDLQHATASINRVQALLGLRSRLEESGRATLPPGPLAVAFERVAFSYDDTHDDLNQARRQGDLGPSDGQPLQPVLHDISFELEPGAVLGLLGRTGSGKTTLTRLLFRLYDPDSGAIRLSGRDLRDVSFDELRARVGMVTQDVQLFDASIRDNLAFFNRRISDAQIEHALRELGLWEWVQSMPEGLDTRLGGGRSLSAGEAQLLAFTRVFLKDPGLVILDEASSRLDPATEQLLERAIARLLRGRTGIIIAHRLHTVRRVDQIMILEDGRIVEHGERARLAADPTSRFAHLLQTGLEEALA